MPKIRPLAPSKALPATVADLEAQRVVKRSITLLDETERALLALYDHPQFRAFRGIDDPEQTVEGSPIVDDVCAAQMIREKAVELDLGQVKAANLNTISAKLRAAEARFNASRKQRAKANG